MNLKSKKIPLTILAITALVFSRALFFFFNDPEGPNLLIVIGTAAALYFLSLAAYLFKSSDLRKLFLAIFIQVLAAAGLYVSLN